MSAPALLAATRPRQWLKNMLVLAAPIAAGAVTRPRVLPGALLALVAFTLAAAGIYLLNDVRDAAADRLHPDKRHRPVASGRLPRAGAVRWGWALAALAAALPLVTEEPRLSLAVLGYLVVSVAYVVRLKSVPVVELLAVASGFVLRPLGGAIATDVPPSAWFLGVCCLGALLLAIGKRYAELLRYGAVAARARPVLRRYSVPVLRRVRVLIAVATVAVYVGWALTRSSAVVNPVYLLSALPLALLLLRYLQCNDRGQGEAPEDLVLRDRWLQLWGLCWFVAFLVGVVGG